MEPFRVLIVDDEPPARRKLRDLFAREPDFIVAGECSDGIEAVRALAADPFDLVLLDVRMPGATGPEVVREVGTQRMPPTVFVTAFDQYAVRAFELHALDYLLKPFDRERFQDMLARARREIGLQGSARAHRLEVLLAELARHGHAEPMAFLSGGRTLLVDPEELEWIEAADNYLRLHGPGGELLVRGTLTEMEQKLAPRAFLRVKRSLLINERAVREMRPLRSGEVLFVMQCGKHLVSGRTYRARIGERWRARRRGSRG